jgi:hypothetical protein
MFQLTEFDRQLLTMAEMQQAKVKFGAYNGRRYMMVPGFRAKFYVSRLRGMRVHYPELAGEYVGDDVRWLSLRGGWELRKLYNRLSVSAVATKEAASDVQAATPAPSKSVLDGILAQRRDALRYGINRGDSADAFRMAVASNKFLIESLHGRPTLPSNEP